MRFMKLQKGSDLYHQRLLRKLKIKNIENSISENDKKLLEFLINTDFTYFLTTEELKENVINL